MSTPLTWARSPWVASQQLILRFSRKFLARTVSVEVELFLSRDMATRVEKAPPRWHVELPWRRCVWMNTTIETQTFPWQTTTNPGRRRLSRIHSAVISVAKNIPETMFPQARPGPSGRETRRARQSGTKPREVKKKGNFAATHPEDSTPTAPEYLHPSPSSPICHERQSGS